MARVTRLYGTDANSFMARMTVEHWDKSNRALAKHINSHSDTPWRASLIYWAKYFGMVVDAKTRPVKAAPRRGGES